MNLIVIKKTERKREMTANESLMWRMNMGHVQTKISFDTDFNGKVVDVVINCGVFSCSMRGDDLVSYSMFDN